jgi:hypothetical protein
MEVIMKIKIALIRSEHITEALELSKKLQEVMEAGDMRVVDQTTEKLLSLADKGRSLSISDELWHQLISQIRNTDENYKSDYIITKLQLEVIITIGLNEPYIDIVNIIKQALKTESAVLQLPYEEEVEENS